MEWQPEQKELFSEDVIHHDSTPLKQKLSSPASAVMDAGRELWRYYHQQQESNPNASFYDIKKFFQGTKVNAKGKTIMNKESEDETYRRLITELRLRLKILASEIEPKIYLYGFLR